MCRPSPTWSLLIPLLFYSVGYGTHIIWPDFILSSHPYRTCQRAYTWLFSLHLILCEHLFCVSKCATDSLLRTSQDCRQASPAPAHSSSSAMPLKCVQNVVLHCLVQICMGVPGKYVVLKAALMVPSQKCKLPLPRALTQPHTMTDPGFWTCCW